MRLGVFDVLHREFHEFRRAEACCGAFRSCRLSGTGSSIRGNWQKARRRRITLLCLLTPFYIFRGTPFFVRHWRDVVYAWRRS
jgi:hypothetical protein